MKEKEDLKLVPKMPPGDSKKAGGWVCLRVEGWRMAGGVWVLPSGNVYSRVTNSNTYKSQVVDMRKKVRGNREQRGLWKR